MTASFHSLLLFVTHSVCPVFLINKSLSDQDFQSWKEFLNKEGVSMRFKMYKMMLSQVSDAEKREYMSGLQQQLVTMSNLINQYLFRERKVWAHHPDADLIRIGYVFSLSFFQEYLEFMSASFGDYYDLEVKVTDYERRNVLPELRNQLFHLKGILSDRGIDEKLIGIVMRGMAGYVNHVPVSLRTVSYVSEVVGRISEVPDVDDEVLVALLIKLNFNPPEFYLYLTREDLSVSDELNGLHEELEAVLERREGARQIEVLVGRSLLPAEQGVRDEVSAFLMERAVYLEELLAVRRMAIADQLEADKAFRVLAKLSVPQLALFFRVQMEVGVLAKEKLSKVFNFVANHFYTEKTRFISAQMLLKRSTDVEFATVLRLWEILGEMMDWLDAQFSVRNYQKSLR